VHLYSLHFLYYMQIFCPSFAVFCYLDSTVMGVPTVLCTTLCQAYSTKAVYSFSYVVFLQIWIPTVNQGQVVSDCSNPFNRCIQTSLPSIRLSKLRHDLFTENAQCVSHGLHLKLIFLDILLLVYCFINIQKINPQYNSLHLEECESSSSQHLER
jgi:hypothetical protein